jgi:hypothetical protein
MALFSAAAVDTGAMNNRLSNSRAFRQSIFMVKPGPYQLLTGQRDT